jgi:DNA-binding CsgD family transcriptional regulator
MAELIDLIYEAALDQSVWPLVTERLADLTGAAVCQISIFDVPEQASFNIDRRLPPEALRQYTDHWVHHNPLVKAGLRQPVGRVLSMHDLIPKDELLHTPIYNEFFAPLQLEERLGASLINDRSLWAAFAIWRSAEQGAFDCSVGNLLNTLIPHLKRALRLSFRLSELTTMRNASMELLNQLQQPLLLVDSACHILFSNPAAEEILANPAEGGLRRDLEGVLHAQRYTDTLTLHKLAAATARCDADSETYAGGHLCLTRGCDRTPISVVVVPLRRQICWLARGYPTAILFVFDPERVCDPTTETLRQEFSFTTTEAAVALEILKGQGLKFAARNLGVSPTTIRTHLNALFHKTGTRRQAEFVRVLLQRSCAVGKAHKRPREFHLRHTAEK